MYGTVRRTLEELPVWWPRLVWYELGTRACVSASFRYVVGCPADAASMDSLALVILKGNRQTGCLFWVPVDAGAAAPTR